VERLGRVTERVLQVSVLLNHFAGPEGRPGDAGLANLLGRLADAVDVLAERPEDPAEALADTEADPVTAPDGDAVWGSACSPCPKPLTELTAPGRHEPGERC
jgi:hypothetical protein